MTRVFSVTFSFKEKSYMAILSNVSGAIKIYVPDTSLHHLLPNGKATYTLKKACFIDVPQMTLEQRQLLNAPIAAFDCMSGEKASAEDVRKPR